MTSISCSEAEAGQAGDEPEHSPDGDTSSEESDYVGDPQPACLGFLIFVNGIIPAFLLVLLNAYLLKM